MTKLINGNCLEVLKTLEDNSIDAVVTDPPYGLSFMGKKWDYDVPSQEIWEECLRVLKPGGYLLAFAGTRTQHRMAVRIEDAGFEIRDMIAWIYASGFPKSLNIGKIMNKYIKTGNASWNGTGDSSNGALGYSKLQHQQGYRPADYSNKHQDKSEITEDKAKEWEGWGTALKPALEPITVARKPIEGNVAQNCLKWGVGGINIDGCRVDFVSEEDRKESTTKNQHEDFGTKPMTNNNVYGDYSMMKPKNFNPPGRFPANLIHDGSEEVVELFPNSKGMATQKSSPLNVYTGNALYHSKTTFPEVREGYNDNGSAARFFYCAKTSKKERNIGCDELEATRHADRQKENGLGGDNPRNRTNIPKQNFHPTVKPIALMEYLIKLVSREGATILDPFMGSGSTGIACKNLNRRFIGIEMDEDYLKIANARIHNMPNKLL